MGKRVFTDEMTDFIIKNGSASRSWITEQLNQKFGCSLKLRQVQAKCSDLKLKADDNGRIKKGGDAWNKGIPNSTGFSSTRFKMGHKPKHTAEVGHESMVSGYWFIKYDADKPMKLKHHVAWEKHNGEIPKGHMIMFKDKDINNCSIDNLVLMSRAECIRLSQSFIRYSTPETHESCILLAKIRALQIKRSVKR